MAHQIYEHIFPLIVTRICTEQPLQKSNILLWARSHCRMPACAARRESTVSAKMQTDFKLKSLCKLGKRQFEDVLFGFKSLIFTELLDLVTLFRLIESWFPPEELPPSGAGDRWWSLLQGQRKASLQHSHQTQVETVIWLWFCPSGWEITDLRFFAPTWPFGGWKSSTRLLHWRWR